MPSLAWDLMGVAPEDRLKRLKPDSDTVVWLREIDAGTDAACWVVCNKVDPGAVAFVPR